ncbi:MAG: preprotein translocase subunit SecG [Oceanicoccus sp.]|jgi:preprotein translocase subunit SecG
MEQIILIVHVLVALTIIGLIMIQQGKGADMGASFGAGASQTLFGSGGGGSILTKATAWLITIFFATSFGLAVIARDKSLTAGDIDIPSPSVIESVVAPNNDNAEIPALDEAEIKSAMDEYSSDIPATDVPAANDIPQ